MMKHENCQTDGLFLHGLVGSNPLAFMAAIGLLRTLSIVRPEADAKMSWIHKGLWRPVLHCAACKDQHSLVQTLMEYNEQLKLSSNDPDAVRFDFTRLGHIIGVKADVFDAFSQQALLWAGDTVPLPLRREPLDFVAAYGSSCCLSKKETVEPTLFSFSNGQGNQWLLEAFRTIRDSLCEQDLQRTLFDHWTYSDPRPTLRWDPRDCRLYALMASDPSGGQEPIQTMKAANYLAFLSLSMLPTMPGADGLKTAGFAKMSNGWFWSWPIWDVPVGIDCIRSLLTLAALHKEVPERSELAAFGIKQVCRSKRYVLKKNIYFSPSVSLM
jgi:hypothetical protein